MGPLNMQHHPAQGCPPQSSGADPVAAKAAQNAISENEKIFPIFSQRLASNEPKEFINTARKLATWLSSEKAYYAAARPKIVELLEIALSAFMNTFTHHSLITEIGDHLRQLVQAVVPFKHLFRENELQSRLQRVILDTTLSLSRTSASTIHTTASSEGSVTANIPSSTVAPLVNRQPTSSPVLGYHPSVWRPPLSVSMSSVEKAAPVVSVHAGKFRARDPPDVASSSQIEALSSSFPVTNTPQSAEDDVSPAAASKPLPKRARRAELSEELIARDLDWFRSNQSATVNKDSDALSSTAAESSLLSSDAPHVPGRSPYPKKKTARMVPSCHLPRRIPLDAIDATQGVESGTISALVPASEPLARKDESSENAEDVSAQMDQMDVGDENPYIETMGCVASSNVLQASQPDDLPSPEPQPVATPLNDHSVERQTPQTDYQSPAVEGSLANGNSPISICPSVPFPEAALDGMEIMDVAVSESDSESLRFQSQGRPELTASQSPRIPHLQKPILPEPPLNLNFRISQIPSPPQQLGIDTNQRRFNDGMTVLHSTQGKAFAHTHVFDINLSESTFSKISKWVKRRSHPSDASQGICISLASYRLVEFFDTIKSENEKLDVETLTLQLSCSWPSKWLSLHIKGEERHTTITLSPPLFLTPDQCVDISSLMKLGNNTLEIVQKDDLSEYLIVLHAHPPTRTQLADLEVVRGADEQWKRLLDVLSGCVVPGKALDNPPAGLFLRQVGPH